MEACMLEFVKRHKYQIIFGIILTTGVAFCIAGFWVPPLLVPGGALIASALGFWQSAFVVPEVRAANEEHHEVEMQPITTTTNNYNYQDNRHVNMLFMAPNTPAQHLPRPEGLHIVDRPQQRLELI